MLLVTSYIYKGVSGTHACVGKLVLPEGLKLQILDQAQVRHASDEDTEKHHGKVPDGAQHLWRPLMGKL